MAGIYNADIYCDACIEDIKRRICAELIDGNNDSGLAEFVPNAEEYTIDQLMDRIDCVSEFYYDSRQYPKYCDDNEECDSPQHCGSHDGCLDPTELCDGTTCGHFFENDLTTDGDDYVRELVCEGSDNNAVLTLWREYYDYIDYKHGSDNDN